MVLNRRAGEFDILIHGCSVRVKNISFTGSSVKSEKPPVLVFLHEGLGSIAQWKGFPEQVSLEIAKRTGQCDTYLYDWPGYGRSGRLDKFSGAEYMHFMALDILADLLERLEINDPILFGHSDGGSVALIYAGAYPHKVRAVITEAAHAFTEAKTLDGIRTARELYKGTDLRSRLEKYHGDKTDEVFHNWSSAWLSDDFMGWNIYPYLNNIYSPVLALQGSNDNYGTEKQLAAIRDHTGGPVSTVLIENCGHSPHKDDSGRIIKEVLFFLENAEII